MTNNNLHFNGVAKLIKKVNKLHDSLADLANSSAARKLTEITTKAAYIGKFLVDFFQHFPEATRPIYKELSTAGWFMSNDMPMTSIFDLGKAIDDNNYADIDLYMMEFFRGRIPQIKELLILRFPSRSKIISAAFTAHEENKFELSVPVFLTQAEGICIELLGVKLFARKKGVPVTKHAIDELALDAFSDSILEPLRYTGSINATEKESIEYGQAINRHEVLHGISTDYNTEMNSLKLISLIEYIGTIVFDSIKKDKYTPTNSGTPGEERY